MAIIRAVLAIGFMGILLAGCNSSTSPTGRDSSKTPVIGKEASPVTAQNQQNAPPAATGNNLVYMDVAAGRIEIELLPNLAPAHVERIKTLVKQGFYDGIVFHRVIDGFMAQTGDPTGTGRGGSDLPDLKAEFSNEPFVRGILGMARSQSPNSANSQFFIMFAPGDFLNGVIKGMDFVDAIKKGDQANNGTVADPDKIIKMQIAP